MVGNTFPISHDRHLRPADTENSYPPRRGGLRIPKETLNFEKREMISKLS